jgi:hypothetical protein
MACKINDGIERGCRDNAGGVYEFYISNFPTGTTVSTDYLSETDEVVTSFSGTSTSVDFYKYVPNKNSSDFTENYQISLENGTVGYEQVVTMIFSKMEAAKRAQVKLMATGNLLVVVKDKNARFWLIGENDAANLSGGNAGTGKALTDLNGYSLTFTANEGSPAKEVEAAAIAGALA